MIEIVEGRKKKKRRRRKEYRGEQASRGGVGKVKVVVKKGEEA